MSLLPVLRCLQTDLDAHLSARPNSHLYLTDQQLLKQFTDLSFDFLAHVQTTALMLSLCESVE